MAAKPPFWAHSLAVYALAAVAARAQTVSNTNFSAHAERAFAAARDDFAARPADTDAAWRLGRASYDWLEFATNAEQRAAIARVGIAACEQALARDSNCAPCHYYLGMDEGELAEADGRSLAAYKLIRQMEQEFKTASGLDEKLDYGGPPRCLGLLYRDAPGWPISIGSKSKAEDFLQRAAALAPDYPENQVNLLESHIQWRQMPEAKEAWQKLDNLWAVAQTNLMEAAWAPSWDDWTRRRSAAKIAFQKTFKQAVAP